MTKRDLIEKVARKLNLTQREVREVSLSMFKKIIEALESGEKVTLRGFGIFEIRSRKARTGRNIRAGKPVPIPSHKVIYFRAGKKFRQKVDQVYVNPDII